MLLVNRFGITMCAAALTFGCAHKAQDSENPDGRAVTRQAAVDAKAHSFVEIKFQQGSASLSDRAKSSLNSVIEQARQDGKIDEVIVMSWSDEELPSKELKRLPKAQRDLAAKRNKAVEEYISSLRSVDVDTYNMAEQPNVLSKWFNTTDNRLKKSLVSAGLPTTADGPQYPSKASHSVILVRVE